MILCGKIISLSAQWDVTVNKHNSYLFMRKPQITHVFAEDFYTIWVLTPTWCTTNFLNATDLKQKATMHIWYFMRWHVT